MDSDVMAVVEEASSGASWQQDLAEVKTEDASKEGILAEPGSSGYTGLLPAAPADTAPGTSSQILEACAEAVVQQSLGVADIDAVSSSIWVPGDPPPEVTMETSSQSDPSTATGYTPMVADPPQLSPAIATSTLDVATMNYCDDAVTSDMTESFRNYMSHLSQLSPEQNVDHHRIYQIPAPVTAPTPALISPRGPSNHGDPEWDDNVIDMCSSDSEGEPCSVHCREMGGEGDGATTVLPAAQHAAEFTPPANIPGFAVDGTEHGQRNPNFPYQSIRTPRVAWGERPREAWNDPPEDHMYDSRNPYALFNLPRSTGQHCKRKQKSAVSRSAAHTCKGSSSRSPHPELPHPSHHALGEEVGGEGQGQGRGDAASLKERRGDADCQEMHVDERTNPDRHRLPAECPHPQSSTGGKSPEPSTSSGISGHRGIQMFGHSKSLPIFSSQESMETNSETGESSDTDVDVISVTRGGEDVTTVPRNAVAAAHCNGRYPHPANKSSRNKSQSSVQNGTAVVRPKAIKLESGQKLHTCESMTNEMDRTSPCDYDSPPACDVSDLHSYQRQPFDNRTRDSGLCRSGNANVLPDLQSSESRVRHLAQQDAAAMMPSPMPVIKTNNLAGRNRGASATAPSSSSTINKSLKDMHNSVIKSRPGWAAIPDRRRLSEDNSRSIDLTSSDGDENARSSIDSNVERMDSPIISEVHLPSASDDSDIEVVKIETTRLESYAGRSRNLDELDQSLVGDLTVVEMHLLKSQDFMRVRGKGNQVVPVLIPEDARSPLDFVSTREVRRRAGIPDKNDYLFPIVGRTQGRQSHARAYSSLKRTCGECSLVAPTRINSVYRKYTATLTQMLNLDKYQVDWVCKHLGHIKSVHKAHYQQMSDFIERVHIAKLLLVQDMNLTKQFKGKKLEDIDVSEIVFPEETTAVQSGKSEVLAESVSKVFLELEREELPADKEVFQEIESTDEDSEEEVETTQKKAPKAPRGKVVRQRWDRIEMEEIHTYFQTYLDAGIVPRTKNVLSAQKKSKNCGGKIWLRTVDKIVKKISAMNHK